MICWSKNRVEWMTLDGSEFCTNFDENDRGVYLACNTFEEMCGGNYHDLRLYINGEITEEYHHPQTHFFNHFASTPLFG